MGSSHLAGFASLPMEPRKVPVQARSTASVDAIVEATFQVLAAVGKDRLTTTRVAARAGVSVGTLYQYFPNKRALLQAALKHHFEDVTGAVCAVCATQRGGTLRQMATALADAFLTAKMRDPKTSVALYAVSVDVEGLKLAERTALELQQAIMEMLQTAAVGLRGDPKLVAVMVAGAMAGVSRRLLESESPAAWFGPMRAELGAMLAAYLEGCSGRNGGLELSSSPWL